MRRAAKKSLPKGWTEGSVQELLGLSDEEAMIVEMRVRMAERVRQCRISHRLTQKQLADRLRSKQPHIARLEQGDASLELMMRALLVMGESTKKIARVLAA
jgi:predicted transcriptional regulator